MNTKSRWDLLILGGGIIGLATGWEALRRGLSVALLEKHRIGAKASSVASGIVPAPFALHPHSSPWRQFLAESVRLWPQWLSELQQSSQRQVPHWYGGYHLFDSTPEGRQKAEKFLQQAEKEPPFEMEELTPKGLSTSLPQRLSALDWYRAFFLPQELVVDTKELLQALRQALRSQGADLWEEVQLRKGSITSQGVTLESSNGIIWQGKKALVAAGPWSGEVLQLWNLQLKMVPVKGEVLHLSLDSLLLSSAVHWNGSFHLVPRPWGALWGATSWKDCWDEEPSPEGRALLEQKLGQLLGSGYSVTACKGGLRPRSRDYRPLLGRIQGPLFISTGHYRSGIALAPLSAKVTVDLLEGKRASLANSFSPLRKKGVDCTTSY